MRNDWKVFIIGGVAMFIGSLFINDLLKNSGFIKNIGFVVYVIGTISVGVSIGMGKNRDGKLIDDEQNGAYTVRGGEQ